MPVTLRRCNGTIIATADDTDSLRELVIRLTRKGISLACADLSGSDLRGSDLRGSDLRDSDLRGSNLRGSDLSIPVVPNLHAKIVEAIEAGGTLEMGGWHQCETTHCRGGWSVHLAGQAGYDLEHRFGTAAAAALIHLRSCPALEGKVPDFYASNEDAMAEIKRLAALETTGATA